MNLTFKDIIPWILTAIALTFTIITFVKNSKKDEKQDITEKSNQLSDIKESLLKLNLKSDQICATTNETRSDIKAMNLKITEIDKELEVVKHDLKTAFFRIDELRQRLDDDNK